MKKKSSLTFLGRDSGFGKLNTSAYAIINNRLLLVDCGYTVMPKLLESNILSSVTGIDVIITHLHADHAGSLSQLVLYSYYVFKNPVNIISNCKEIDNFLTITGASRFLQTPGFPKERYTRNNDFVTFIKTDHVEDEITETNETIEESTEAVTEDTFDKTIPLPADLDEIIREHENIKGEEK